MPPARGGLDGGTEGMAGYKMRVLECLYMVVVMDWQFLKVLMISAVERAKSMISAKTTTV